MKELDLHMHSKYSDGGQYEPIELLKMCKATDLDMMAIVDHNSIKGSRVILRHQQEYGTICIPIIEIDTASQDVDYHVLGCGIDVHSPAFDETEEYVASQGREANKRRRQLVRDMGIAFNERRIQELSPGGITTGETIGEAAIEYDAGKKNPLLQSYYPGEERSNDPFVNFYWDICAPGKPAYMEIFYPNVSIIVRLPHQQSTLAIVAHPGMNAKGQMDRIHDLLQFGVDGFGVFSSYHSGQQAQFYYDLAKNHGLYMTYGSDFHGRTKPVVHIGMCSVEEEENTRLVRKLETLHVWEKVTVMLLAAAFSMEMSWRVPLFYV